MEELEAVNKKIHSADVPAFAMRAVKGVFDGEGLFNPGKVLPE